MAAFSVTRMKPLSRLDSMSAEDNTSLDDDRHLHVAVARAAVVIADCRINARLRRDRDGVRMIEIGIQIDAELLDQKPVRAVCAGESNRDRLAGAEMDFFWRGIEAFRRDVDDVRRGDGEENHEDEIHTNAPFVSCWTPLAPPISRSVSSTSSTASGALRTWRMPRFAKGCAAENGSGFFSAAVAGSGNAKISDRAA